MHLVIIPEPNMYVQLFLLACVIKAFIKHENETRSPVTPNSSLLQRFLSRVNLKPGAEESITWGSKFLITAEDPVICGPSSLTAAEDQVTGNPKFLAAREDLVSGGSAFLIDSEGVVPVTE
ncbi:hypothetical protein ROHU_009857 [Labeo rohita]|uniref:Uncharacterized protein n=1 Tax=Labeo rohita TaxID=84645 RepID=A0A498M0V5_LABRO|nr:hypothetical protein ROHU_009857 [Labeo rohita]